MNDENLEKAKQRMKEALDQTKPQLEEAANQLTKLFKKGAAKAKEAADAASQAIRDDINKRP
jgi:ElaB/YqjD/DUF883 family membrane-anchored ribosome-binding protein